MRLEVLTDTALRQMEPARLIALIAHVQRFIDKAVAYQRHLIAVAESQRAARAVGDACVADTLVRNTGMSRGAARRAARQARTIAKRPAVAGALACGDINADQAEAIAGAVVADETRAVLVAAAVGEGTDATRERVTVAETEARDETPEQCFMRQHANRYLRFYNNRDGMVCLEGALDPDNGARLKAKVAAIAGRMWRNDKRQAPSQRRSPQQRDIDALCAATSQPPRPDSTPRSPHADGLERQGVRTRGNAAQRSVRGDSDTAGLNGEGSSAVEPGSSTEPRTGRAEDEAAQVGVDAGCFAVTDGVDREAEDEAVRVGVDAVLADTGSAEPRARAAVDGDDEHREWVDRGVLVPSGEPQHVDGDDEHREWVDRGVLVPSGEPQHVDGDDEHREWVDRGVLVPSGEPQHVDGDDEHREWVDRGVLVPSGEPQHVDGDDEHREWVDRGVLVPSGEPQHVDGDDEHREWVDRGVLVPSGEPQHVDGDDEHREWVDRGVLVPSGEPQHVDGDDEHREWVDRGVLVPSGEPQHVDGDDEHREWVDRGVLVPSGEPQHVDGDDEHREWVDRGVLVPSGEPQHVDGDDEHREWVDFDSSGRRVVPVLRVSTSLESLHDGLHRAGITDSGEHLSAATLRRLACDAEIIPTVLNSKGRVIDVGRRTRVVGEGLRSVLIARDGCCVWPGCDASPSRCDAHHVKHWAHGGPTNADNLALLCHRHHTLLHEGRHRLERLDDAWTVLKPDGTPLHPPPASTTDNTDTTDSTIADATGVCSADPVAASGSQTQAVVAPDPGRRAATSVCSSDPVSQDRDRRTIRAADSATSVCSADLVAASGSQTQAVVAPDPGGPASNSAATERPKQLTLACHGHDEVTIPLPLTDDSSEITRTALRADPMNSRRAAPAQHTPDAQAIDTVSNSNPRPAAPVQHQQGRGSRENPLNTVSLDPAAPVQHQQGRGSRENPLNTVSLDPAAPVQHQQGRGSRENPLNTVSLDPAAPAQHQQSRSPRENPLNTTSLDPAAPVQHQQGRGSRENPPNHRHQAAQDTRPP